MNYYKLAILLIFPFLINFQGCKEISPNKERLLVSSLVAAAIYKKDPIGSDIVCERARNAIKVIGDVRSLLSDDQFKLLQLESKLRAIFFDRVNPVTREGLLQLARSIVEAQMEKIGTTPQYSELTTNFVVLADIAESVANGAIEECVNSAG